jgi:hypothetical protein
MVLLSKNNLRHENTFISDYCTRAPDRLHFCSGQQGIGIAYSSNL